MVSIPGIAKSAWNFVTGSGGDNRTDIEIARDAAAKADAANFGRRMYPTGQRQAYGETLARYMQETGIDPRAFQSPTGAENYRRARSLYDQYSGLNPQASIDAAAQARQGQASLAELLTSRATGQTSAAAEMFRQAGENAAAEAFANARAGGAYNPGLAGLIAERAAGDARSRAGQQAAVARLQEQEQALGQLGGLYGQMRGQDMQQLGSGAGLQLGLLGALNQMSEADRNALMAREQLIQQGRLSGEQLASQERRQREQNWFNLGGQAVGGVLGGLGSLLSVSDERLKTDITDESKELDAFLGAIKPNGYRYKDKKFGEDWYVSPMAQELEKSKIGKSMVIDTPDGKMVDYGRGLGAMLAASARLSKRLDKLEGKKARSA